MSRRLLPVLVLAATVLAACSGGSLSDPKEIVAQGLDATGNLTSFHMVIALDGKLPRASGTSIGLTGATVDGDVAVSGSFHLTFALPTLLGLTGEMLVVDRDTYIRTSLTGAKWSHLAAPDASPEASGASASFPTDPKALIAKLKTFLAKDGVTSKKLDDVDCAGRQCYHVQVTIPSTLLTNAGAQASMDPSAIFGEALVLDLQFDKEKFYLTKVSVNAGAAADALSLTVTLSAFDVPVTVTPPPADEVQEGGFNFPGGLPGFPGS